MKALPCTFVDVFATKPLSGNGLAVVLEADGLSDESMLAFAREARLSETTFVQRSTDSSASYRNRIWTPTGEIPLAGHPSLGTAVAVARYEKAEQVTYVQQTHAGLQRVSVRLGLRPSAEMVLAPPVPGPMIAPVRVAEATGLAERLVLAYPAPQVLSCGLSILVALVDGPGTLDQASPDYGRLRRLLKPVGAAGLYMAHVDPDLSTATARCFAADVTVGEDPATGSGAAALHWVAAQNFGVTALTVQQGHAIGRPSQIEARLAHHGVHIAGHVHVVLDGQVYLPNAPHREGLDGNALAPNALLRRPQEAQQSRCRA